LQYGNDISFTTFNRYDRQLGFSRFDVDGLVGQDQAGTLNAFLFSDRGIYRPGEEIRLASIVREAHWRSILVGVPVELVVTDPRGLEIHSQKLRLSGDGFQEFQYQTRADSLTGAYGIALYTIKDENRDNRLGSTEVQVEEFLPDRMRLRVSFSKPDTRGWVSPENLKTRVDLAYLFGAPAANHRVSATIRLTPGQFYFPGYTDYTFFDPAQAERGYEEPLESIVTDENGHGEFDAGVDRFGRATYSVLFTARGFEADGGRSVYAAERILVSPLQHLVGYKADGSLTYIPQYSRRILRFIAIDPELNLTAVSNLKYRIIEQSYHSDLVRAQDNTYRYQSVLREQEVDQGNFQIQSNGQAFVLNTSRPGDFELRLYNAEGDLLSKVFYRVAGAGNLTLSRDRDAEMEVVLNKRDYAPGETILLNVRAPYTGAGLITIERDKVYTHKWFLARTQSSVQSIQVPAGVEGNAYVSVTFIRSPDSPEIFSSPLSYNTQPFSISRAGRENQITLSVPEKMEPGQRIPIRFRTSRAGRIVVYAVDEGILQVGRYTTPDPLAYFFRKRALSVTTSQIVDLILPEYSVVRQVAAPGGGSDI
ncbi:MAG: hypothetical protein KDK27_17455, partial [Leptospiraceae bacterium]|nr:hypothetical protein [Leptospiraceae bacterium]